MHRTAIALVVVALVTAGAPAAQAQPVAGAPAAAGSAQAPNLRACFDGRCKITVSRPVSFRISSRFGFTRLSVVRTATGLVKISGRGASISGYVTISEGGTGRLNNLSIRALSITGTKATLRFTPTR